jgi:hypothetical protein
MRNVSLLVAFSLFAAPGLVAQVPWLEQFGVGCGGSGGRVATIDLPGPLRPGYANPLLMFDMTANMPGVVVLGNSNTSWQGNLLPYNLAPEGMPGCTLLVGPLVNVPFTTGNGSVSTPIFIPPDPNVAAMDVYAQAFFVQPGLNLMQVGMTNAVRGRITPLPSSTSMVSSVSQHGITFHFASPVQAGQFVNGDWFVVGPVTLVDMSPATTDLNGRMLHGAMINPDPMGSHHGYDGLLFGPGAEWRYLNSLNVSYGLSPANPRVLQPGQNIVKTISNVDPAFLPQIRTCAVLTCLPDVPPEGSFRPSYAGSNHQVRYDVDMIDWSQLHTLSSAAGAPNISTVMANVRRPWLDASGWSSRYVHPVENMPDYGRDFTTVYGEAALLCHTNLSIVQRRELAIHLVQIGIDFYGNVQAGCRWEGNGGQCSGRKFPILFAGGMLGDVGMLAVGQNYRSFRNPNGTFQACFGEDCQTFYVQETSPGVVNYGIGGYTTAHIGLPEWGFAHVNSIASDKAGWLDDPYRRCCTANAWVPTILAARIMGLKAAWNHDALFDYQDRYMQTELSGWRSWSPWAGSMWDLHRSSF